MVQFWSKRLPNPSFESEPEAHIAADWTLLMWHVAQQISDCVSTSLKESTQASADLSGMSSLCVSVCQHLIHD